MNLYKYEKIHRVALSFDVSSLEPISHGVTDGSNVYSHFFERNAVIARLLRQCGSLRKFAAHNPDCNHFHLIRFLPTTHSRE